MFKLVVVKLISSREAFFSLHSYAVAGVETEKNAPTQHQKEPFY
jgi:hypothetical protein